MYSNNDDYLTNPSGSADHQIGFFSHQSSEANLSPGQLYDLNEGSFINKNNNCHSATTADYIGKNEANSKNYNHPQPEEEIVDTSMKPSLEMKCSICCSEENYLDKPEIESNEQNINYIISKTQTEIKSLLNKHQFEEIIKFLNTEFTNFLMINKEILYLIMKMKFFDLLLVKEDTPNAESYYFEYFRRIGKETRKNWDRKEQTFLKLLKNPGILKNKNVFEKNAEDFMLDLNRALYKYLYQMGVEFEQHGLDELKSRANSMETVDIVDHNFNNLNLEVGTNQIRKGQMIEDGEQENKNPINNHFNNNSDNFNNNARPGANNNLNGNEGCNGQNQEEIKDLSQFSTKEEFSDFEEEIESHEACYNNLNNLDENPSPMINFFPPSTNQPVSPNINQNFLQFIESQNKPATPSTTVTSNESRINNSKNNINNNINNNLHTSQSYINDKNSNFHIYHKQFIPKTPKNEENLCKKLPLLKSFKPKYTKRENIDKKILRRFKIFLKEKYKERSINLDHQSIDKHFWVMFINGNFLPPMKFIDKTKNTSENIEFKSFNSKFLLWLFNKKGAKEFYDQFNKEEGNSVLSAISADYQVHDSNDLNQLRNYISNLAFIFDLSNVQGGDNITGYENSNYKGCNGQNNIQNHVENQSQAPMPTISVDFNQKKNCSKSKNSKEKEADSDDECLRLNRRLERSRELDFLNFDTLNDFGSFYNNFSEEEE